MYRQRGQHHRQQRRRRRAGRLGSSNSIRDNSIYDNALLGISLSRLANANQAAPVWDRSDVGHEHQGLRHAREHAQYLVPARRLRQQLSNASGKTLLGTIPVSTISAGSRHVHVRRPAAAGRFVVHHGDRHELQQQYVGILDRGVVARPKRLSRIPSFSRPTAAGFLWRASDRRWAPRRSVSPALRGSGRRFVPIRAACRIRADRPYFSRPDRHLILCATGRVPEATSHPAARWSILVGARHGVVPCPFAAKGKFFFPACRFGTPPIDYIVDWDRRSQ